MANQPFAQEPSSPKRELADHIITIKGIVNGKLDLSDGGRTEAWSGESITWEIMDKSGVSKITGIFMKAGHPDNRNVFSRGPEKVWLSKKWKGELKTVTQPETEYYSIKYKKTGDNKEYDDDPIIQLNP